jgi:hypothetical protein
VIATLVVTLGVPGRALYVSPIFSPPFASTWWVLVLPVTPRDIRKRERAVAHNGGEVLDRSGGRAGD